MVALVSTSLNFLVRVPNSLSVGSIKLYREFKGNIEAERLVIVGESARFIGALRADTIIIEGTAKGRLFARRVLIERGARVHADIQYQELVVERGSEVIGRCRRQTQTADIIVLQNRLTNGPAGTSEDDTLILGRVRPVSHSAPAA